MKISITVVVDPNSVLGDVERYIAEYKRLLTEHYPAHAQITVASGYPACTSWLVKGINPRSIDYWVEMLSDEAMKLVGVDSNIMSLSGIAIAIGTIVDMGIIVTENILRHVKLAPDGEELRSVVQRATSEVGGAVVTAISTTVVSFLPVFTMIGAEGKLFRPLAFTKTFALLASVIVAIVILPTVATLLLGERRWSRVGRYAGVGVAMVAGLWLWTSVGWLFGLIVIGFALYHGAADRVPSAVASGPEGGSSGVLSRESAR